MSRYSLQVNIYEPCGNCKPINYNTKLERKEYKHITNENQTTGK